MDNQLRPTVASEIVVPPRRDFCLVELLDLKTASGERVRVRCDRLDEVLVLQHVGLPGDRPSASDGGSAPGGAQSRIALVLGSAAPLVHAATSFANAEGAPVRPAFHCDEAHAVPGSVPWDAVSLRDKLNVINSTLELCGFGGAAETKFPAQG